MRRVWGARGARLRSIVVVLVGAIEWVVMNYEAWVMLEIRWKH